MVDDITSKGCGDPRAQRVSLNGQKTFKLGGMRDLAGLAIRGELPATIGRRYTLDQSVQACVDFARRHTTGKPVVTI